MEMFLHSYPLNFPKIQIDVLTNALMQGTLNLAIFLRYALSISGIL